jgi:hypothetical protein
MIKYFKLKAFIYLLLRDEMPFGTLEHLIKQTKNETSSLFNKEALEQYAEKIVERLLDDNEDN